MDDADAHEKDLPITFAVGFDGTAIAVSFPEKHKQGMDGPFLEDNNFKGLPENLEPGFYKGLMDFDFYQGYCDGYRADGESDWTFTVTKYEKVS